MVGIRTLEALFPAKREMSVRFDINDPFLHRSEFIIVKSEVVLNPMSSLLIHDPLLLVNERRASGSDGVLSIRGKESLEHRFIETGSFSHFVVGYTDYRI